MTAVEGAWLALREGIETGCDEVRDTSSYRWPQGSDIDTIAAHALRRLALDGYLIVAAEPAGNRHYDGDQP